MLTHDQVKDPLPGGAGRRGRAGCASAVQVDDAMMEAAPKLRVIGRAGVGVDNIEPKPAPRRGIAVMNTPGGNAIAVAEHALGVMLAMARQIATSQRDHARRQVGEESLRGRNCAARAGHLGLGESAWRSRRRARISGWSRGA